MKTLTERFLKYVSFDTQSDEFSETCPSTEKQKLLGAYLVEEMKAMGIEDARMDEHGYVFGTVPGDPRLPTIGMIAHMDTSPDTTGKDVKARIVEYAGEDICLNANLRHQLRDQAAFLRKKGIGQMGKFNLHILTLNGQILRVLDGFQRFLCKFLQIHKSYHLSVKSYLCLLCKESVPFSCPHY